ncbi:MAG: deoxyribonuclease V [Gammaproteobacteria bacterium]|nr:deoxyribonuclease V [Gammaproteobacteria bacterium]
MHRWDLTPQQAIALQQELRLRVVTQDRFGHIGTIAGVDVGFEQQGKVTRAAVAVLAFPSLQLVASSIARQPTRLPYIPGLLSFREVPAVLEALQGLETPPDMLFCDGQGYAHPRRFGIACHLGLLTDIPSIGVGKRRLIGTHQAVATERGERQYLYHQNEIVGVVLRNRTGVKPVYVSSGHRVGLHSAVQWVEAATTCYRLPEPIRQAHRLASG